MSLFFTAAAEPDQRLTTTGVASSAFGAVFCKGGGIAPLIIAATASAQASNH